MLRMLNDQSQRKTDRSFFETAQEGMRDWRAMMAQSEGKIRTTLKPQVVAAAFDRRLPQNAILVLDAGQNTEMAARHSDLQAGPAFSESGTLASMAFGLPYAIDAGLAFAGCPIFAAAGGIFDGRPVPDPAKNPRPEEQHAEPDRLGTDDVPGQSPVCL